MSTYYETLGVSTTATPPQIRRAYLGLAFVYHPDKNPHNENEADIKFEEVRRAYSVLSNKDKRRRYDRSLKSKQPFESNLRINSTIIVLKWVNLQKKSSKHEAQNQPQNQKVSSNLKPAQNCSRFIIHKSQSFPSLSSDQITNVDIFRSMINEYKCEDMCSDKQKRRNLKNEDSCKNMLMDDLNNQSYYDQTNDTHVNEENGQHPIEDTNDDDFPKIVDVSPLASIENLMLDENCINTAHYYEGNDITNEINKAKDDVVPGDTNKKLKSETSGDINEDNIKTVIKNIRRNENISNIFDKSLQQKDLAIDNLGISKKDVISRFNKTDRSVLHKKQHLHRNDVSVSEDNLGAVKDNILKKPFRSFQSNTKDTVTNIKNPKCNNKETTVPCKNLPKEENEKDVNVSIKYLRLKKKQSSISVSNLSMTGRSDPNVIKPTIDKNAGQTTNIYLKGTENIVRPNNTRPYKNESRTSVGSVRPVKGKTETPVSPEKSLLVNRKESKMSIESARINDKDNISVKYLRLRKKNASSTSNIQSVGKNDILVQNVIDKTHSTPTKQLSNKDSRLSVRNLSSNQKDINTNVNNNRINRKDSRASMYNLPQLECENVSIKYLRLKRKTSSMSSTEFQISTKPETVLNSNFKTIDKGSNNLTRNPRSTSSLNQSNEKDVKNIRPIRTESRRASMQNLNLSDKENVSVKYLRLKRKSAMSSDNITMNERNDKNPIKTTKATDKKSSQMNMSRSNSKDINARSTNQRLTRTDSSSTFDIDQPNSRTNQTECDLKLGKFEKLRTKRKDAKPSTKKPQTCEKDIIVSEDNSSVRYLDKGVEEELCIENLRTYGKSPNGRVKNIRPKRKNSGVTLANLWTNDETTSNSKDTIMLSGKDDNNEKVPDIINIGAYLANLRLNQFNSVNEDQSQDISVNQLDGARDVPGSVRDGKFSWDFGSDEESGNSNLI